MIVVQNRIADARKRKFGKTQLVIKEAHRAMKAATLVTDVTAHRKTMYSNGCTLAGTGFTWTGVAAWRRR